MARRLGIRSRRTLAITDTRVLASAFAALGYRKLKVGGIIALVMPLTVATCVILEGKFRDMLASGYSDLTCD